MGFMLPNNTFGYKAYRYMRAFGGDGKEGQEEKYLQSIYHSVPSARTIESLKTNLRNYLAGSIKELQNSYLLLKTAQGEESLGSESKAGVEKLSRDLRVKCENQVGRIGMEMQKDKSLKEKVLLYGDEISKCFNIIQTQIKFIKESKQKTQKMFMSEKNVLSLSEAKRKTQIQKDIQDSVDKINEQIKQLIEKYQIPRSELLSIIKITTTNTLAIKLPTVAQNTPEKMSKRVQDFFTSRVLNTLNVSDTLALAVNSVNGANSGVSPITSGLMEQLLQEISLTIDNSVSGNVQELFNLLAGMVGDITIELPINLHSVKGISAQSERQITSKINEIVLKHLEKHSANIDAKSSPALEQKMTAEVKVAVQQAVAQFKAKCVTWGKSGNTKQGIPYVRGDIGLSATIENALINIQNQIIRNAGASKDKLLKKIKGGRTEVDKLISEGLTAESLFSFFDGFVTQSQSGRGTDITLNLIGKDGDKKVRSFQIQVKCSTSGTIDGGKFLTAGSIYSMVGTSLSDAQDNQAIYLDALNKINTLQNKVALQVKKTSKAIQNNTVILNRQAETLHRGAVDRLNVSLNQKLSEKISVQYNKQSGKLSPLPMGMFPLDYLPLLMGTTQQSIALASKNPKLNSLFEYYIFGQYIPQNLLNIHFQIQMAINSKNAGQLSQFLTTLTPLYALVSEKKERLSIKDDLTLKWFSQYYSVSSLKSQTAEVERILFFIKQATNSMSLDKWFISAGKAGGRLSSDSIVNFLIKSVEDSLKQSGVGLADTSTTKDNKKSLEKILSEKARAQTRFYCSAWVKSNLPQLKILANKLGIESKKQALLFKVGKEGMLGEISSLDWSKIGGLEGMRNIETFYQNWSNLNKDGSF